MCTAGSVFEHKGKECFTKGLGSQIMLSYVLFSFIFFSQAASVIECRPCNRIRGSTNINMAKQRGGKFSIYSSKDESF